MKMKFSPISLMFSFQIASTARGRGVLRLLLIQQQMNLLCIPALCLHILPLEYPPLLCQFIEIMAMIVTITRTVGDLAVALGR